ncbi:MAG: Arc family DNA-binding protein [Pseudomonadota bacterium]
MPAPVEQTNLRIPAELKGWLQSEADKGRRSLTSEVVVRLEQSRAQQQAQAGNGGAQ